MLIDDFKSRFPEFDSGEVDTYFPVISDTYKCYYNFEYGINECDDEAILQLCAHLFLVQSDSKYKAWREVASRGAGKLSVSYAVNSNNEFSEFFKTTKYGQLFLLLTNKKSAGGYFV